MRREPPISGLRVVPGFTPDQREAVARLYWSAFGDKLGKVFGPQERAIRYLCAVLREDHCFTICDVEGRVWAVAGYRTPAGSFSGGDFASMRAIYGLFGALWRHLALRLLVREVDNYHFLTDGLVVAPEMRGRGLGSALLTVLCQTAEDRGYRAIRLEVVEGNRRARALYERCGFCVIRRDDIGALRWIFGFESALVMARPLPGAERTPAPRPEEAREEEPDQTPLRRARRA